MCVSQSSRTFSMLDCSYSARHYSAVSFYSCKLRWRIDECVLLSCFNAQPDIFAVMNCSVAALNLFSSDILTWSVDSLYSVQWHKIRGLDVEEYAYYVNKLRQKVGFETWIWRQKVTSQTAHTKHKWPPYATEWTPPWKFCVRHCIAF